MSPPVKVLYIIGKGRSGSTILDLVLGQMPGFFSAGELFRIWDWGLQQGHRCGCGRPVPGCEVWGPVLGSVVRPDRTAAQISSWQRDVLRWPSLPRLLRARPSSVRRWPALAAYADVMRDLYEDVAARTGARVIVDSSKWPAHPGPLGLIDGIEPYAVHLVRDPRAVAHSWKRRKGWTDRAEGAQMPRFGALHTSASWVARNALADRVRVRLGSHAILLRYEAFAADPAGALARIASLVGEPAEHLPISDGSGVTIHTNHTVSGNPSRMTGPDLEILEDRDWRGRSAAPSLRLVGALTSPLRRRYGYGAGSDTFDKT